MNKYTKEIAIIFSTQELDQIDSFIKKLSIDQIKIIKSEVLPTIEDATRRRQINNSLKEQTDELNVTTVIRTALQRNDTTSDQLKVIYEDLIKDFLLQLKNEAGRKKLLNNATGEELAVIQHQLSMMELNEQTEALLDDLAAEKKARDNDREYIANWHAAYLNWRKDNNVRRGEKHKLLQWEIGVWQNLIKKNNQINAVLNKPPVKTVEDAPKRESSLLSNVVNAITSGLLNTLAFVAKVAFFDVAIIPYAFYKIGNALFGSTPPQPEPKVSPPVLETISEEERDALELLRVKGAQDVAKVTGLTAIGGEKVRDEASIESSLHTRFGMVLASQMVAGTKNANHRNLNTVIESLTREEDDDATIRVVQGAIKRVLDGSEASPLNGEHACSTGGYADLVTAMEFEVIDRLVNEPESFQFYGVNLSKNDKKHLATYHQNMDRTRDLMHILKKVGSDWGGYAPTDPKKGEPKDGYKKVDEDFDIKQKAFEDKLSLASRGLQEAVKNLRDGESLYLETGLERHAMQLIIKKEGSYIKLSTYDSSGALENTSLLNGGISNIKHGRKGFWDTVANVGLWTAISDLFTSIAGVFQVWRMGSGSMRKNALTFSVPEERIYSSEGLDYLSTLIRSNSMAGWAQTHIELQLRHTTMEERSHMGYFDRLRALNAQADVYSNYIKNFSSIASDDAVPEFQELLQRPQNTQNCFAKKAQACELYELGKGTYKKVRLAMLLEQKAGILNDVCGKKGANLDEQVTFVDAEYTKMLRNIEPAYLSPAELHQVSMRLCELKRPSTTEYYEDYFKALFDVKEKLIKKNNSKNQPAIDRINEKISSHAKEFYLYLKNNRRDREIQEIFASVVYSKDPVFDWKPDVMPLKTDEGGVVDPNALQPLSAYSNAISWKAVIQLLNHQIRKLSVNERHIQSEQERLSPASTWGLKSRVTVNDLEEGNVVTFNIGAGRKESIKVELNVGGTRQEIDKDTFFELVVRHKAGLTNPKVVGLLDYLRNSSPDAEEQYSKVVYAAQHAAFINKLATNIEQTVTNLKSVVTKLSNSEIKLAQMIEKLRIIISSLTEEIEIEKQSICKGKSSVTLKNLESRLDLLRKEVDELERLKLSAVTKFQNLKGDRTVEGSVGNRIAKAEDMLGKLKDKNSNIKTINAVSQVFTAATQALDGVAQHLDETIKTFEGYDIESEARDRGLAINQFRTRVITHHMETNAEYRILDELAALRMGTEKDRNRNLYKQTAEERARFFKEGKNTFLPGSVFEKIQSLNQRLKAQAVGVVERKVILSVNSHDFDQLDSMESGNNEYIKIDNAAEEISKEPIPDEIKKQWVHEMFTIWLEHESAEKLYSVQNNANPTEAINNAVHHFLEQKANIKYASLQHAGYPITLAEGQAQEMGMKPVDIGAYRQQCKAAALLLASKFRRITPKVRVEVPVVPEAQLTGADLVGQYEDVNAIDFTPPKVQFVELYEKMMIDGSTLKFLRENPTPTTKGTSQEECQRYFKEVASYLHKLKAHTGLENKGQRITELCHAAVTAISALPYPPSAELVTELTNSMLERYRVNDEEKSLGDSFMNLENAERSQLLANLIKLNLSQIDRTKVNPQFFSTIKQWEKLITPRDEAMSAKIKLLTPAGTQPIDMTVLKEVDRALHESPIGLEGIYEGQKGLQVALSAYGKETAVDEQLRRLADRLGMRNGDALLAHQFIAFYSDKKFLLSIDGINSTQGRELFERAFLDALRNAKTEEEKHQLLDFVKNLPLDQKKNPCALKAPHEAFIDELLLKAAVIDPKAFKAITATDMPETEQTDSFVDSLTKDSPLGIKNPDATDRLFGFARDINILALKIEIERNKTPVDQVKIDELHAKLICSNLAYQLIYEQASDDTLSNLNKNFEFSREMGLLQVNINKLQDSLVN